ncbi:unnamed protein product [Eretmochelys imbricata]
MLLWLSSSPDSRALVPRARAQAGGTTLPPSYFPQKGLCPRSGRAVPAGGSPDRYGGPDTEHTPAFPLGALSFPWSQQAAALMSPVASGAHFLGTDSHSFTETELHSPPALGPQAQH